ncbi:TetR/AcrR family transcriptional regulator [Mesorhizobium sp. AR02]|uniref:TetR/AcrR family transcriptional regulator n=1 Tax=Mesorhizobium sp. AR02 TaxID=2865837 RepID=UPI002160B4A2|nr:TetR/AcrR family transcriptional regulator [Mesorhizobium sp. AR02]UVK52105.1 TetR/AcrR family transcriptional regulator [Mesorhizobium sp. AR02]
MTVVIVNGAVMESDSRAKMVRSAALLIASHGVNATSFSDVLADSGAPRGSIYHHFPEGKHQLAQDAVRLTGEWVLARQRACAGTTAADVLSCFVDLWRQVVLASAGASGCAVAGVAIDSGPAEGALIEVVRSTFRSWVDLLRAQLEATGVPSARAASISVATVAGMEGALILCRAEGNSAPLDTVADELMRLLSQSATATDR